MKLEQYEQGGILVVRILSKTVVYANADAFKAEITDLIRKGGKRLVLDLGDVEFIDSRGLGVFISILKSLGPGGALVLCSVCDNVCKVFELTKLNTIFNFHPNVSEAVKAVQAA